MIKKILGTSAILLTSVFVLTGCGNSKKNSKDDTKLTVAASPSPHAEILEHVAPLMKKEGIELEVKKFDDYVMPNKALASGDVDANYFQHVPFYKKSVKENDYKFAIAGAIHIEPMGLYSKTIKKIKDLKNGSTIITSDSESDWGRIINILQKANLVKLKSGVNFETATFDDISENPKNLKFVHNVKPEILVQAYKNDEGTLVAINANFAYNAKLNPVKDAILLEKDNSPYVNILAIRKEDEKLKKIKKLNDALHKKEVQDWISKRWNGSVKPVASNNWK
jgi:D-methionine transport system substrate-binding protein